MLLLLALEPLEKRRLLGIELRLSVTSRRRRETLRGTRRRGLSRQSRRGNRRHRRSRRDRGNLGVGNARLHLYRLSLARRELSRRLVVGLVRVRGCSLGNRTSRGCNLGRLRRRDRFGQLPAV